MDEYLITHIRKEAECHICKQGHIYHVQNYQSKAVSEQDLISLFKLETTVEILPGDQFIVWKMQSSYLADTSDLNKQSADVLPLKPKG